MDSLGAEVPALILGFTLWTGNALRYADDY